MRRLVAAGLLPERAGQPVKVWAHISLADLLRLDGSSALQDEWTAQVRARLGRAPGRRVRRRRRRRGVAGRRRRRGHRLRRGDGADRDRRRERRRAGRPGPAVRRARQAPPRRRPGADAGARRCAGRPRPGHRRGPGGAGAGDHRQGRGPAVRSGRPGQLLAPPAARRPPRRPQPAAGHRLLRDHSGRDPQRGHAAGPALPVGRPVRPARRSLRGAPYPSTRPTAARHPSRTASCSARSTTRSSSTGGAGPWS